MATATVGCDIVPTSLAVKAMRDNGYRNAAYAVAELIDNSIQAKAKMVELLCADERSLVAERERESLDQLAVLDNGTGMDAETLEIALQFGNGSRLEEGKKQGMGRFGMGLPSASISQCMRVEVWSWQDGPEKALYSYIDLDEIDAGELDEVPVPVKREIPVLWRQTASDKAFGKTGTLVVWSNIDRVMWRTTRALITNSQELIGRMYRDWISTKKVTIRMARFVNSRPEEVEEKDALPNDPMYLMKDTSAPDPYDKKPMFKPFPSKDSYEMKPTIRYRGKDHEVTLRFSIATEEAREPDGAGNLPYGRHAGRNTGVSVVRAGRELELDPGWTNQYDPRERWWGVEVRFEPGLDELFGVSNNKQFARNFSEAAKIDVKALARDHGGSVSRLRDYLEKDEDPLAPLITVISRVQTNIAEMRKVITSQAAGKRRRRHEASVEQRATEAVGGARRKATRVPATPTRRRSPRRTARPRSPSRWRIRATTRRRRRGPPERRSTRVSSTGSKPRRSKGGRSSR